ncbi:hypothetical protein BDA99DRAFT_512705 [Phascolomyces articulosus]|uniref:Uncharacterized protein n=1 Tax=Phascolomyces articulosus TaxID=60185 RepID=A0AAD5PDE5_9FUNG|nr:hypothetical protein BDA99DRAFT_512705 [Phascolomyces articulosus]
MPYYTAKDYGYWFLKALCSLLNFPLSLPCYNSLLCMFASIKHEVQPFSHPFVLFVFYYISFHILKVTSRQ